MLKDFIIDFDSCFNYKVKSFKSILFCNFVFNIFFETFIKLGYKSFIILIGLFRILLKIYNISDGRFSLFKILNNSFSSSAEINISEDFDNFFFKICKRFKDLSDNWLLYFDINNIFKIIIKIKFDLVKYCFKQKKNCLENLTVFFEKMFYIESNIQLSLSYKKP